MNPDSGRDVASLEDLVAALAACGPIVRVGPDYAGPPLARPTAADIANDPRARQLLRTLVSRHIRDGEPVGSQTLARHAGLDVSPATIRNILASLEDAGLLRQVDQPRL